MVKVHVVHSGLRIIRALHDEFPYVAQLDVVPVNTSAVNRSLAFCTASLLSATWSLTAAHCIRFLDRYSEKHPDIEHKIMLRIKPNEDLFEILSLYKHPAFRGMFTDDFTLIENDIGKLKTESISYAKVSAVDFSTVKGQAVNAAGYGRSVIITKWRGKKDYRPPRPLKVLDLMVVGCPRLWHLHPAVCVARDCGRSPTQCVLLPSSAYTQQETAVTVDRYYSVHFLDN